MKRIMLALACGFLLAGAMNVPAQTVAGKGVRVVVPSPPGGFNDVIARVLTQGFNEGFAPGSFVDNKPGAGTVIGTESVVKSAPDGSSILIVSFPFTVMNALYPGAKFDVIKDFAALAHIAFAPSLLLASASAPYKSVAELIEAAKAKPGSVLYASTSNGSSAHLFMELFKSLTGTSLVHVPYKGNDPAMLDVISGRVPVMFANLPNGLPHVKSGRVRALAITALKRFDVVADVPTMAEAGIAGFEADIWWGAVTPAATPRATVMRLNAEINRILATAEVRKTFHAQDVQIVGGTPERCADHIREQVALWSKVVRNAKIQAD